MKIRSEAKVGIIGIITLVVLIWGINYLKGRNMLSSNYELHAFYENSLGLEASSPVLMNGVKIGYIDNITLDPDLSPPISIVLSIEKNYPIRKGSRAVLTSDLLGTKTIEIQAVRGRNQNEQERYLADNDTITATVEPDLFTSLQVQIMPVVDRISALAGSLDTLVQRMDTELFSQATRNILEHLSSITRSLKETLDQGGSLHESLANLESFSSMLTEQEDELTSLTGHLNSISATLDSAGLDKLSLELITLTGQFNHLMTQVNSGEGNAGKLFYSDSLYINLEKLTLDFDQLIRNLNDHPEDYVQISVFGKSKK